MRQSQTGTLLGARPFLMKTHFPSPSIFLPAAAVALLLVSCGRKDDIRVYEVIVPPGAGPAAPAAPMASATSDRPAAGPVSPAGPGMDVKWNAPAAWETQPLSSLINKGYYKLPETAGSRSELTISAYPGTAGGLAPNVNRWRRQLGLAELPAAELEKQIGSQVVDGQILRVCELIGTRPDGSAGFVFAAVLSFPAETWFFKMTGQAPALEASRTLWQEFLKSLDISGVAPAPVPASPPTAPSVAGTGSTLKVGFVVPDGWEEQPTSGMRDASFRVPGPDGKDADVSLIRLSGGTDAQNVNMWRQQLGLAALPDAEAAGILLKVQAGAREIRFYDQSATGDAAERPRILAAIWDEKGTTWVARLRGGHLHLEGQKESFLAFLSSLQLP